MPIKSGQNGCFVNHGGDGPVASTSLLGLPAEATLQLVRKPREDCGEHIRVAVRCRPVLPIEEPPSSCGDFIFEDTTISWIRRTPHDLEPIHSQVITPHDFFSQETEQEEVFQNVAADLVETVATGTSGTIFVLGARGTGRKHTAFGSDSAPGLLP
eukprot:5190114-Amphidinium_carterae.1